MLQNAKKPKPAPAEAPGAAAPAPAEAPAGALAFPLSTHTGGGPSAGADSPPPPPPSLPGSGRPLDPGTRAFYEARLGRGLGAVRVHTGPQADASARGMNALAYTVGRDVVFREGRFAPSTGEGKRLLAHELAHVAQQGHAPPPGKASSPVSPAPAALLRREDGTGSEAADERHAEAVAERVAAGGSAAGLLERAPATPRAPVIRRAPPTVADKLPEPISVMLGKDRFEATLERRDSGGGPQAVVKLRYVGALRTDLSGGVLELTTYVGSLPFDVRQLPGVENELVLDLYSDHGKVLRVEDSVEFDPGPPAARKHGVNLRDAGKVVYAAMNFRVYDPAAAKGDTRAFQQPEMAGRAASTFDDAGETVLVFDGDGDGWQELEARVDYIPRYSQKQLDALGGADRGQLVVWLRQRASADVGIKGVPFDLPPEPAPGVVSPHVEEQSNGTTPTRIALTIPTGTHTVVVHPGRTSATGVDYEVEANGKRLPIHLPPDPQPPRRLYTAGGLATSGRNAFWDVDIGPYGDRFRITVDRGVETRPVIGIAPFYRGEPVGGRGAVLTSAGPLAGMKLLTEDLVTIGVDLDGDGKADVRVNDRIEQPADTRGSTPEGDRDHRFSLTGPALPGGASFTIRWRGGWLDTGHRGESEADKVVAGAMLATPALATSATATFRSRLTDFTDAFGSYRKRALDKGWLTQATFDAWYALSADMVAIDLQLQGPTATVDGALATRASDHARAYYDALAAQTLFNASGIGLSENPYTGARSGSSYGGSFSAQGPAAGIPAALAASQWGQALSLFREATNGLDRLVVDRAAAAGERDAEQIHGVAAMGSELRKLADKSPTRVPAVFVPDRKFEHEPGYTPRVPLELYHWKEGTTWRLVDLTNPLRPFYDSASEQATPLASVATLMHELDNKRHFTEGRVYFDFPGVGTGQVAVTDQLTWQDFFTWLGIGLAIVGTALAIAASGGAAAPVGVAGMYLLAGSAVAGATAAGIDLVEGYRHGTLTTATVLLDLAQIVGAIAGLGAMAAGRVLAVARASAAASAPLTGARWAAAATLAQRAVIPLAATNVAADTVMLAVITVEGIQQLDAIDRSDAPASAKENARLRILGQLALTGGLTALSLRGNVAEITAGRSIEVVNVAGEPVVVPVGTSYAGKAIEKSTETLAAATGPGQAAAEAKHLEAVRNAVGGTGGVALAEAERLAIARAAGRADAKVVADAAGAVTSGATAAKTLPELVEEVARANNAARAHGLPNEYVLEMIPGTAAGTTEAKVVSRPRSAATAASTAHLYLNVVERTAAEAAQITRLRAQAGTNLFRVEMLPEGLVRINGQVDVHPARLAEVSDVDLKLLMSSTHALDLAGGDLAVLQAHNAPAAQAIKRFSSSDPEVKAGKTPTRGYRFRFVHNRQQALEFLDGLLAQLGTTRAQHPALANLSTSDLNRLYDLANASVPGGAANLPTRATRYALDQKPANARAFVEHYEFYAAEYTARVQAKTGATSGKAEKRRLQQQVEREMGDAANPLVPDATVSKGIAERYQAMARDLAGRFGQGSIAPRLSDVDAVRAVQKLPDVQFGSEAAAVYHTRKHFADLPEPHQKLRTSEVQSYLDSAGLTIRGADAQGTANRLNTAQDGSSRSFAFEFEGRRAIVVVTNDGRVILATYP